VPSSPATNESTTFGSQQIERRAVTFPLAPGATSLEVRALVDRSVVEFFVADGRADVTSRVFPAPGADGAWVSASTAAVAKTIVAHEMGCGWV
jgi:sucrose-6-phosphate hydrolase SacC (GH32 family)